MSYKVAAYSFKSPMPLQEMLSALNRVTGWKWYKRENDNWGEYLLNRSNFPWEYSRIRIVAEGDYFIVESYGMSELPIDSAAWTGFLRYIREELMPLLRGELMGEVDTLD